MRKALYLGLTMALFMMVALISPAQAEGKTQNQIDVGYFTCWLHSDGVTWQNIPGFGVKEPGNLVTFSYTVTYDGPASDQVTGVKDVSFYESNAGIYGTTYRDKWQPYVTYDNLYGDFIVTRMEEPQFVYKGNKQVNITITVELKTKEKHGVPPNWGQQIKEPWQAQLTDGRKFYTPVLIEWELAGPAAPDFYPTPQGENLWKTEYLTNAKTYSGKAGSQIQIPFTVHNSGAAGSSNVAASWQGQGWGSGIAMPAQNINIGAGGSQNFTATVTVPKQGDSNKLYIRVNIDGNTPANESNKNNNIMVVTVLSEGDNGVSYLTVVPSSTTIFVDEYEQFRSYLHKPNGSATEVTQSSVWSVSNATIAQLQTTKGKTKGISPGQVNVRATYQGLTGEGILTVKDYEPPPPPNYNPVADFNISNPTPVEGQQVQLRDRSSHPGAKYGEEIVSWEWSIEEQPGSSSQNVNVTWEETGTYKITLRVEDQDGDSDSCTKSVVVGPALPAAVITLSSDSIIIGREVHVDGDLSTAAMGRSIKWDEMEWKIYAPNGSLKRDYTGRYPLGKGTPGERNLTNSVLNQAGNWTIKLKVKDTNDNESEQVSSILTIYPDQPPIADFWMQNEALRNTYEGYQINIYDKSHPAVPDGALGDEIYIRTWTLYYDGNNDGDYIDAGDQVINPGESGKAGALIQTSGNDIKPLIKFNKTGRYKVELTVRERAEVWGVITNGMTGNTVSKPVLEKEIIVLNLIPSVAFEIKKKMPVDVQFAADYTVSDSKYNSLQSAQAGFIGALEAGGIDPVTGVQRVQAGEVGQNYCVTYNPFFQAYYLEEKALKDTPWVNGVKAQSESIYGWHSPITFNLDNGSIIDGQTQLVEKLSDGSYYKGFYITNNLVSLERVDKNLNILTPRSTYDSIIASVIPANADGWTYTLQSIITTPNGSFYVWYKGEKPSGSWIECKQYLQKINYNRTIGWACNFMTYYRRYDSAEIPVTLEHSFSDNQHFIFKRTEALSSSNYWDYVVMVGSEGFNNILSYQYPTDAHGYRMFGTLKFSPAMNNSLVVIHGLNWFKVANASGIISSQEVPIDINNDVTGWQHGEGACLVAPYSGNQTAVLFSCAQFSPGYGQDYAYLYTINNSTGAITLRNTFTELWPGNLPPTSGWATKFQMTAQCVNESIIGVKAEFIYNVDDGPSDIYYSVIKPDYTIAWTTAKYTSYFRPNKWSPKYEPSIKRVNDNLVDYVMAVTSDQYTEDHKIYGSNGTSLVASGENGKIFDNGTFILQGSGLYKYYNSSGFMLWQKSTSEGEIASSKVYGTGIVFKNGNETRIINPANGNELTNIPHLYIWNDSERIICYGISSGSKDGTIRSFSQKQGLQYLTQAINDHAWDAQKTNIIVSVIDGDSYKDYATKRDSVISQIKTNHLKLAVISPSSGQTKAQGEYMMNQAEGGWWIQTAASMPGPLAELAQKIIALVNLERGADNIVLVNQKVELSGNYSDPETDPAGTMRWEFTHNPAKLGSYNLCNSMGVSYLNGAQLAVPPTAFDKVGTYQVRYRAKDNPVTNPAYINHPKAGAMWSSSEAYLTILVHRKPIANFTLSSNKTNKTGTGLGITDNSYDPDLVSTDTLGQKGLRAWEWQYRLGSGEWISCGGTTPTNFPTGGSYKLRLRVQDNFAVWSDWSEQKDITVINQKPIAIFTATPNPTAVGYRSTFDPGASYDPDGDTIIKYRWVRDMGAGTSEEFSHTSSVPFPLVWNTVGNFPVTLWVQDSQGLWSDPYTLNVTVDNNIAPVAQIVLPEEGYSDEEFLVDGKTSYDPDAGDYINKAYWQYKKPGQADWDVVAPQLRGQAGFLEMRFTPTDLELGIWTFQLVVEDNHGLASTVCEKTINVVEGWELSGYLTPNPGERGRKMIVTAYAHRKGRPAEKIQITTMTGYIVYGTKQNGQAALPGSTTFLGVNMEYAPATSEYKYTYLVPDKTLAGRWSDDGAYYIRVVGRKNTTEKEALLPFTIQGHILNRVYIKTRSW